MTMESLSASSFAFVLVISIRAAENADFPDPCELLWEVLLLLCGVLLRLLPRYNKRDMVGSTHVINSRVRA